MEKSPVYTLQSTFYILATNNFLDACLKFQSASMGHMTRLLTDKNKIQMTLLMIFKKEFKQIVYLC